MYIVVIDMFSSIFYRDIFTIWYSLFNQFIIFGPDITNLVKNWCKQHKIHQILMQIMVRQACDLINLWTNIHISLKIGEISGILIHPFTLIVIDNKLKLNYVCRFVLVFKLKSYLIRYKGVVNFLYKLVYYT